MKSVSGSLPTMRASISVQKLHILCVEQVKRLKTFNTEENYFGS